MGMGGGGTGGAVSEINVTPLIDVLLVLLIIFMVIVPVTPKGLEALVPQPPKDKTNNEPDQRTVVVQILANGTGTPSYKINEDSYAKQDIGPRLQQIFATRNDKTMFIKGDKDLDYGQVATIIDASKAAGVDNIGIITPHIEAGQ